MTSGDRSHGKDCVCDVILIFSTWRSDFVFLLSRSSVRCSVSSFAVFWIAVKKQVKVKVSSSRTPASRTPSPPIGLSVPSDRPYLLLSGDVCARKQACQGPDRVTRVPLGLPVPTAAGGSCCFFCGSGGVTPIKYPLRATDHHHPRHGGRRPPPRIDAAF
jgi:hypothetical protein